MAGVRDKCIHFFHVATTINVSKSKISGIIIDNNLVEQEDLIANHVCVYKEGNATENQFLVESVESLATSPHNLLLTAIPSEVEILYAICDMNLCSAPSSNGFISVFFKLVGRLLKLI